MTLPDMRKLSLLMDSRSFPTKAYYSGNVSPSFLEPRTTGHYTRLAPQANHELQTGNVKPAVSSGWADTVVADIAKSSIYLDYTFTTSRNISLLNRRVTLIDISLSAVPYGFG